MNALESWIWSNVEKTSDGHWRWRGATAPSGYGIIRLQAHRALYMLLVGEIPEGRHLDHLCREPNCVNPEHLEAVTPKVNILRGEGFGAKNARKTHCIRGHEFSPENTGYHLKGGRYCLQCKRDHGREWARKRHGKTGIWGAGAYNVAKTHCPQGHEYSPENTYIYQGRRHCRTCVRERKRARSHA